MCGQLLSMTTAWVNGLVNFTTYDMHCKQDTINLSTSCCDIMVLANREADSDHPYTYARV